MISFPFFNAHSILSAFVVVVVFFLFFFRLCQGHAHNPNIQCNAKIPIVQVQLKCLPNEKLFLYIIVTETIFAFEFAFNTTHSRANTRYTLNGLSYTVCVCARDLKL